MKIRDCHAASIAQYGYTRDEFAKLIVKDLLPVDDQVVPVHIIKDSIRLKNVFKIKRWQKKKNGELIFADITGQLINYNGEDMMLAMCIDITESHYFTELDKLEKNVLENSSNKQVDLGDILSNYLNGMEALHPGMF